MSADQHDMLALVLAVELDFVDEHTALKCARDMVAEGKTHRLDELLENRGILTPKQAAMLRAMVDRAVSVGGASPRKALALLPRADRIQARVDRPVPQRAQRTTGEVPLSGEFDLDAGFLIDEVPDRYAADAGEAPRELSRRGLGRIVLTRDTFIGRLVALKEMLARDDEAPSEADEARFVREARVASQIQHPAVIPVFDLHRGADGRLGYTMQHVVGDTLFERIRSLPKLRARLKLVPAVLQVAHAIAVAHQQGAVHRDINSKNVMLGKFGEVSIIEWGKARARTDRDVPSFIRASPDITGAAGSNASQSTHPQTMSPEHFLEYAEVDERSDVWCLGAMLYEVLTGNPPWQGETTAELAVVSRDAPPPIEPTLPGSIPSDLLAIVTRAMSRDPEARYPSASELAIDLTSWVRGRPVLSHRYSVLDLLRRFFRANRLLAGAGFAVLVVVSVLYAIGVGRFRSERERAFSFAQHSYANLSHSVGTSASGLEVLDATVSSAESFVEAEANNPSELAEARRGLSHVLLATAKAQLSFGNAIDARVTSERLSRLQERATPPDHLMRAEALLLAAMVRADGTAKERNALRQQAIESAGRVASPATEVQRAKALIATARSQQEP